jgi:hypothetical protein
MAAATAVTLTANRDERCEELAEKLRLLRQENRSLRTSCSRLRQENTKLRKAAAVAASHVRRNGELAAELRECRAVIRRITADVPFAAKASAVGWRGGRMLSSVGMT